MAARWAASARKITAVTMVTSGQNPAARLPFCFRRRTNCNVVLTPTAWMKTVAAKAAALAASGSERATSFMERSRSGAVRSSREDQFQERRAAPGEQHEAAAEPGAEPEFVG